MSERHPALPVGIEGVAKRYGGVVALELIDLEIRSGEFLTLLGPSGSGKTTLLTVLAGFVRPDAGVVRFGGRDVTLVPPHKRNIGMVFQSYALFPHLDVAGNVGYPLRVRGVAKPERQRRVAASLETVALGGFEGRRIDQLSGGQQQRVALARAIVSEPPILLMDEPLSALDKNLRERMQVELRTLHERIGTTTVYVTHDQREALTMSDRIAVMAGGRIRQLGTPEAIYRRPADRFVGEFIGESAILPVTRNGVGFQVGGTPLRVEEPPDGPGPFVLLVRPENLIPLAPEAPADGLTVLEGRIARTVYHGDSQALIVTLPGIGEVTARTAAEEAQHCPWQAEAPIRLGLRPRDTRVLAAR